MEKGLFIVFEGIDGSGKSSCMESVAQALEAKNRKVIRTAEPTKDAIGLLIKSSTKFTAEAEALLFVADRAQHTHEIEKWLDEWNIVLCDRYYASTLAYQSANLEGNRTDMRWLEALNRRVAIKPDMTFLFDIDPEVGLERVESRGSKSRFENLNYLKEVRKRYLKIALKEGFEVIDASKPKEVVFKEVMKRILKLI